MSKSISPSIFNDVIGPVMRGPSSSHSAGALRIGSLCRQLMNGNIKHVLLEFDPQGSLATTHDTQGSDMGFFSGLMGWEANDERLPKWGQYLYEANITWETRITNIGATHPNTYRITLVNSANTISVTALSTGGGMIELTEIDGFKLSINGDSYELLLFTDMPLSNLKVIEEQTGSNISENKSETGFLYQIKLLHEVNENVIRLLEESGNVQYLAALSPVLPIHMPNSFSLPFLSVNEMLAYNNDKNFTLAELALEFEKSRSGLTEKAILDQMKSLTQTMKRSIETGLAGTKYDDRILGYQSGKFQKARENNKLFEAGILNKAIENITAIMETKSSMGVIVAAPTAGSCGTLPGTLFATAEHLKVGEEDLLKSFLAAGIIGIFIANRSTFAAEECGCQAECGSASGMTAAGLVTLAGGTLNQALAAASMALQNSFGMTCDPVANRVEVPCLGKNVMAASNAISCANMALAGFDQVIPLDEVIEAFDKVGRSLPQELRCTAKGGLSVTPTSKFIENNLNQQS